MKRHEFTQLTALAAIVEQGSFARAATHLGVTPSALSQTVRALEERLGVRLLNRTTRSVAPTEAGARLVARVGPALAELSAAVAEVDPATEGERGVVRLNVPRVVARYLLMPVLGRLAQAHPHLTLELSIDDAMTDIVAGRFDAGVRLGERLDRDMVAVKLGEELRMVAVASPAYLERHGEPRTPRDLLRHRCINWRSPSTGLLYPWEFERRGRAFELVVAGPLIVNEGEMARLAAEEGVGIAYLTSREVQSGLDEGTLRSVLDAWSPSFEGFHLYYPDRRHVSPALRLLLDFLRAEGVLRRR